VRRFKDFKLHAPRTISLTVVLVVCLKLNGGVQDAKLNRSHTDSLHKPEAKGPVAGPAEIGCARPSHAPLSRGLISIDPFFGFFLRLGLSPYETLRLYLLSKLLHTCSPCQREACGQEF
jgi:hypothetical protein